MKIARNMNLVIPVETETGTAFIHATPISKEVYREHFLILSKTYAGIFTAGLSIVAGPRIAYLMLEKISKDENVWDTADGVRNTLVGEIIRLSNLVYPVEGKGWDTKPLDVAIEQGIIDEDEVMSELVFFTCVSTINKPAMAVGMMERVNGLWNSAITSLGLMEWIASLVTSKPGDNSGEMENTLSATSSTTAPEPDFANSSSIPG